MAPHHQHVPAEKARSGEISGRVRNVLFISTGLAMVALALVAAFWMG
nr:hypothetical protein [uncultured Dongia sp.]